MRKLNGASRTWSANMLPGGLRERLLSRLLTRPSNLVQQQKMPNGPRMLLERETRMIQKAQKVASLVDQKRLLTELPTTEETIERLTDRDYTLSEAHVARTWRSKGLDECRDAFVADFIWEAARRHIPVHCEWVDYENDEVMMVHSQYGEWLDQRSWAVLGRIGHIAMPQEFRTRIRWRGYEGEPAMWRTNHGT